MKTLIKAKIHIISILFSNQTIIAQCHIDDWYGLRLLYLNTDGNNWNVNNGWEEVMSNAPPGCNLALLYGVSLDDQGRVDSLNLRFNRLNGIIPAELGNLNNLIHLHLIGNQLHGTIPAEIGNLENLTHLHLYNNQLNGSISAELGNLGNLEYLFLYDNQLSSNIPAELGSLSKLTELILSGNQISGIIPTELGNLSDLTYLSLDNNQLNGNIPAELGNLSNLTYLSLSRNQLSGSIPAELGNLSELTFLSLRDNQLNDNIPTELGSLNKLVNLWLFDNQLSGSIPAELANLGNLMQLWLQGNQLSGSIPAELGSLNNLTQLWLHGNLFSGCIPAELSNLSNLKSILLLSNQLNGCYADGLTVWCNKFKNSDISNGNNFNSPWEDFCSTGDGVCVEINPPSAADVWPGDVNYDGKVNNADRSVHYLFFGESGTARSQQGINWQAYTSLDWEITYTDGNNLKHFDCNGNGLINSGDNNAITLNWGEAHEEGFINPDILNSVNFTDQGTDYQIYLRPTNQVGNPLIMDVVLESIEGNDLNLFGGYFTIDYDNTNANIMDANMSFSNSWLGDPNNNLMGDYKNFPNNKKIEIAFSKINGLASLGNGVIGYVTFQLENNFNPNPNNPLILNFAVNQIGAHDAEGNLLPIEDRQCAVNIGNITCPNNLTINELTPFQNLYISGNTIITNSLVCIGQNQHVEYRANRVTLNTGFSVRASADFKVRSSGCN